MKTPDNSTKYILLETCRKNGNPVRTTVWFVQRDDKIYVVTRDKTGKIKRLRNNPKLRYRACTFNGKSNDGWVSGHARFVDEQKTREVLRLRKKKYGFLESVARFVSKSKGELIVFAITQEKEDEKNTAT